MKNEDKQVKKAEKIKANSFLLSELFIKSFEI